MNFLQMGVIIFVIFIGDGSALFCYTANTKLNNSLRERLITGHNDRRRLLAAGQQILADGRFNIPAKEILPMVSLIKIFNFFFHFFNNFRSTIVKLKTLLKLEQIIIALAIM